MISAVNGRGIIYGHYQMDCQEANRFVRWLCENRPEIGNYFVDYCAGSREFGVIWMEFYNNKPCTFKLLQKQFKELYA
jgi:hypothetical protein